MIFLFYDLTACNRNAEIVPLATTLTADLRNQFNYVFVLLISMTHFKSINFYYIRPKIKLFLQKKLQKSQTSLRRLVAPPLDPRNSSPNIANFWLRVRLN